MNDLTEAPAYTPPATLEEWQTQGRHLAHRHKSLMCAIAEWCEYGFRHWGIEAQNYALATFGKSKAEIAKAMDVHKRWPPDARLQGLSYSHYVTVLPLGDEAAQAILEEARTKKLTISALPKRVTAIRESEGGDVFEQIAAVDTEKSHDDWLGQVVRLLNRAPKGADGRNDVAYMLNEANGDFIEL